MDAYRKQKEKKEKKPDYKTYTLDDFRRLNKEVRLGGLGPDVENETLREKVSLLIMSGNVLLNLCTYSNTCFGRPLGEQSPIVRDVFNNLFIWQCSISL